MKNPLRISLKTGERVFINGAILRVDRKVILELLNDINFMLEQHVLHEEEATTPLRHLYFIVQMILISPEKKDDVFSLFCRSISMLSNCFHNEEMLVAFKRIEFLVMSGRFFEALKIIRSLYFIEEKILSKKEMASSTVEYICQEIASWK